MSGLVWLAVTGLLVHVVLPRNIESIHRLIRIPKKPLCEFRGVTFRENVVIGNNSPYRQSFSLALFDGSNFRIWDKTLYRCAKRVSLVGGCHSRSFSDLFRERVCELFRLGNRNNFRSNSDAHISSGGATSVDHTWLAFKPNIILPLLVNGIPNDYGDIGPQHSGIASLNDRSDALHCSSRSGSFSNVTFHSFRLFPSSLNRFPELYSLIKVYAKLSECDNSQNPRKDCYPPVIRRFLLAIFGVLIYLCLTLCGFKCFDYKRSLLGAALISIGWLLAGCGLMLFWMLNFTWSWGWML